MMQVLTLAPNMDISIYTFTTLPGIINAKSTQLTNHAPQHLTKKYRELINAD
jgi:hypothetical protein